MNPPIINSDNNNNNNNNLNVSQIDLISKIKIFWNSIFLFFLQISLFLLYINFNYGD